MNIVIGSSTALITPFKNGKLDERSYAALIERQIKNGMDAVCPVGTTGESATLSYDEDKRCMQIAVEVCKGTRTKVLAGAGSNSTSEAILNTRCKKCAGVWCRRYIFSSTILCKTITRGTLPTLQSSSRISP